MLEEYLYHQPNSIEWYQYPFLAKAQVINEQNYSNRIHNNTINDNDIKPITVNNTLLVDQNAPYFTMKGYMAIQEFRYDKAIRYYENALIVESNKCKCVKW